MVDEAGEDWLPESGLELLLELELLELDDELDELEELEEELLTVGMLGVEGMLEEVLGILGMLELELLDEGLGMLGEELGEPEELGMPDEEEDEEDVDWQPAKTITEAPSSIPVKVFRSGVIVV